MIGNIASIAIITTAVWMISTDPAHKFHHAAPVTVAVVAPVKVAPIKVASIQPPAKPHMATASEMRRALNESNLILDGMEKKAGWQ